MGSFSGRCSQNLRWRMEPAAHRKLLYLLLRLAVTAGLLWVLATRFNVGHVIEMAGRISLPLLGAALTILVASILVNAVRWQVVLAAEGSSLRLSSLTKLLFAGLFF